MTQNDVATGRQIDTQLAHERSLDVLARHLYRHRPRLAPIKQRLVSNLIEQMGNYENNPDRLRPLILESINRLEATP